MGHVDDYIYNKWDVDTGLPYYDKASEESKFVKVFSVGDFSGTNGTDEKFVLYSDGTLAAKSVKLSGSIEWTEDTSPSRNVYASKALEKPANGSWEFEDHQPAGKDPEWHKTWGKDDTHYCHTDNV